MSTRGLTKRLHPPHISSQYVPPRHGWQGTINSRVPSPLNVPTRVAELPDRENPGPAQTQQRQTSTYYEDVDPRFAETSPRGIPPVQGPNDYDDIRMQTGPRSPTAESDRSNFTSISQRGINPRWNPPPMPNQAPRRPVQQRQDMLLNNNPDFELGGNRGGSPPRTGNGLVPGSAYPSAV
jgi:hypothetical protein